MHPDKAQNIRQVQLPSGKVIEVVYFADQHRPAGESPVGDAPVAHAPEAARTESPARTGGDLHVCPRCDSCLVYPLDWAEAGSSHWEVSLRCPECEWREVGTFAQTVVEEFDIELDRGAEALLHDLKSLAHANMSEDIERFARALEADHIVPSDF
jgi:hypothetical protein